MRSGFRSTWASERARRDYHTLHHSTVWQASLRPHQPSDSLASRSSCRMITTTRDFHALQCQSSRVSDRLGSIMQCATSFATPLLVHFDVHQCFVGRHGARLPLTSFQPTLIPRRLLSFYSQAIINEHTRELNYRIALLGFRIPNFRKGLS